MPGLDVLHLTKKEGDKTLERGILRVKDNTGASAMGGVSIWDLTTLRSKAKRKEKLEGTLAQQLANMKTRTEGTIEEEGSDNEMIARKMAKKGKRVLRKDRTSLS